MLEASRDVPLNVFVMLSSRVLATNLETSGASGASLDIDALFELMQEEGGLWPGQGHELSWGGTSTAIER